MVCVGAIRVTDEWDEGWPYHGVLGFFQWWWERKRVNMILTLAAAILPLVLLAWMVLSW